MSIARESSTPPLVPIVHAALTGLERSLTALGCAMALGCAAAGAETRVIYVDQSAPSGGDGSSWQHAFNDLQDAILSASAKTDDHIEFRVAQGVYTPDRGTKNRRTWFDLGVLGSAVTLSLLGSFAGVRGANPDLQDYVATQTVLSADLNGDDGPGLTHRTDNCHSLVNIRARDSIVVDGFVVHGATVEDSSGLQGGGGMFAYVGGWAPAMPPTVLRVSNCVFEENQARESAAGGLSAHADVVTIADSQFRANSCGHAAGGGLLCLASDPSSSVERCLFDSNVSIQQGGGIFVSGPVRLERCVFVNNSAGSGGGAFGTVRATACLFVRNSASADGGAVSGKEGCILRSCTVANNVAPSGSALFVRDGSIISSSIIWGNSSSSSPLALWIQSNSRAVQIDHTVLQGGSGAGIHFVGSISPEIGPGVMGIDPRFIRPALTADSAAAWPTWNYRLKSSSPAIGAGGEFVDFDLDGNFYSSTLGPPDAGAYFVTSTACAGNIARTDSVVNDDDFVAFLGAYKLMLSPPADPAADLNHDGLVDDADFSIFGAAYDALLCP